jgi:MSHA biogenesis protein MshJ
MQAKLTKIIDGFMALSLRERVLAILAVAGVLWAITEFAWVRPLEAQGRGLRETVARQNTEAAALEQSVKLLAGPVQAKANGPQLQERDRMRAAVAEAETFVRRASSDVKMGEVVRMLARSSAGVKLASLRTVPSEKLSAPAAISPASAAVSPVPPLYRHGVEVVVNGSYAALVSYLRAIEQAAPGMYWGNAKLDVNQPPDCTLKFILYSFSVRPEVSFE